MVGMVGDGNPFGDFWIDEAAVNFGECFTDGG